LKIRSLLAFCLVAFSFQAVAAGAQSMQNLYSTGAVEFAEDLVFGSESDDDEGVLFGPAAICVDDEGYVYVLDFKMFCVKKYGPDGEFLLSFSRQGEGPGELAQAYEMTMTPDGRLVVFDGGNHRFTVFDGDGEYVDSHGFQGWVSKFQSTADGSFIILYNVMKEDWMEKGTFYRVALLGSDLTTETAIDSAYIKDSQIVHAADNSMTMVGNPFVARFMTVASPGGPIMVTRTSEYRVRILSSGLEPVREITRDAEREKVTDADREEYFEGFENSDENFVMLVRKKVSFPRLKPAISDLYVDETGHILVESYSDTGDDDTSYYDVFTPEGDFVNRVEMMSLRSSACFKNGYLYMRKSYDDELPVVIRYRPGPAGAAVSP